MARNVIEWEGRTIEIIPINKIRVDEDYQRKLDKGNIERINNPLKRKALRAIVVSLRPDGYYYVLDGQHRCHVMDGNGYTEILAEVHRGLSVADEASLFVALNETRHVKPGYKFRANLHAGCNLERDIHGIISSHGLTVSMGPGRPRLGVTVISSLGMVKWIYEKWDRNVLDETLRFICKAFRNGDGSIQKTATMQQFLKGVAFYLRKHGKNASDMTPLALGKKADNIYDAAKANCKSQRSDPWCEIANWFEQQAARKVRS